MKQKRKIILTIIISLVFCLAIAGGIIFLALKNKPATPPNQEPPPPEILTPTLTVPSSVSVDLLDSLTFTPTVQNLGSYTLSITIENTSIAIISNNIITPKSIGTTKIISKINTSPAIVKETTLKVLDCTKQVDFYITDQNNQPVEKYYTNTSYILEVRQNILPSSFPQFYYDNIKSINLVKTQDSSYFFEFTIENAGEFKFEYNGTYVNLSKSYTAHNIPTNFEVNFSQSIDSQINLYLYNSNFTEQANTNDIYNSISYEIITTDDLDIVTLSEYDNTVISITNNTITALREGSTFITFSSSLSKVNKTYTITVSEVVLTGLIINGTNKPLDKAENIELSSNESYTLSFLPNPVFAICNLNTKYNQSEILYENNSIKLISGVTNSSFYIYNNQILIYTLNISLKSEIGYNVEISQNYVNATMQNKTITATYNNTTPYLQITCTAYNDSTNHALPVQDFSAKIQNKNICQIQDAIISSGIINLKILNIGQTELIITDNQTNNTIVVIIIIN